LTITGTDGNGVAKAGSVVLIVGTPPVPSRYIALSIPCRIADTRNPNERWPLYHRTACLSRLQRNGYSLTIRLSSKGVNGFLCCFN
jgi:hypothetical protein